MIYQVRNYVVNYSLKSKALKIQLQKYYTLDAINNLKA